MIVLFLLLHKRKYIFKFKTKKRISSSILFNSIAHFSLLVFYECISFVFLQFESITNYLHDYSPKQQRFLKHSFFALLFLAFWLDVLLLPLRFLSRHCFSLFRFKIVPKTKIPKNVTYTTAAQATPIFPCFS